MESRGCGGQHQPGMGLREPWAAAHGWAWDGGRGERVLGLSLAQEVGKEVGKMVGKRRQRAAPS